MLQFLLWCLSSDPSSLLGTAWEAPGLLIFHKISSPGSDTSGLAGSLACASTEVYAGELPRMDPGALGGFVVHVSLKSAWCAVGAVVITV